MKDQLSADDIDTYLAGAAGEGNDRVREFLIGHPEGATVLDVVKATVHAWGGHDAIGPQKSFESRLVGRGAGVVSLALRRFLPLAAVVLIGVWGIKYLIPSDIQFEPKTYSTAIGQRANIQLPDGSSAILGPSTTLKVSGKAGRTIELSGKAVFSVAQNNSVPFVVNAYKVPIRVLGTSFGVRAYYEMVTVAVREGRVKVSDIPLSAGQSAIARAGERPGDSTRVLVTPNADVSSLLAWTEGKLSFRGQSLGEVVQDLELNYGAQIDMNSSLSDRKVILDVGPNDTLSEVLDALAKSLDARVERHGAKYVITI